MSSKNITPLRKYLIRLEPKASFKQKQKTSIFISNLTQYLQQHNFSQLPDVLQLNNPISKNKLLFYIEVLLPAWKEMLSGNILPLFRDVLGLQITPQLLNLSSSLLLFVNGDTKEPVTEHLRNIETTVFYIKKMLDGDMLMDTLESPII